MVNIYLYELIKALPESSADDGSQGAWTILENIRKKLQDCWLSEGERTWLQE
jgi:hypothetical protein